MPHTYKYARPALAVDCVVFGVDEEDLKVLLIQRTIPAGERDWALPGGFVRIEETLEQAAERELREETGLRNVFLEQLYTFGDLDRDPRERVVSVAYFALVKLSEHKVHAATDASAAEWTPATEIETRRATSKSKRVLAFDHGRILEMAKERLRSKVRYAPLGFELLPSRFTLRQLQHLYETLLERPLDKRNFRRKILGMDLLVDLNEVEQGVAHRAAKLYRFDHDRYKRLQREGFHFEI